MVRVLDDVKLDFSNVLIRPKRSTLKSRSAVSLSRTITFKHSQRTFTGVPCIAANMDTTGTFAMAEELAKHQMMTAIHKHYTPEQWKEWKEARKGDDSVLPYISASTGILEDDWKALTRILDENDVHMINLDVANGYSESFVNFVRLVREKWPTHTIMAGNVVTGEMVEELILSGADVVKVGIGPGSVCTTRKKTGVGYPQLSAVMESADAAHGLGGMICSDGGCNTPGDVAKAFGGGADFVMVATHSHPKPLTWLFSLRFTMDSPSPLLLCVVPAVLCLCRWGGCFLVIQRVVAFERLWMGERWWNSMG